MTSRLIRLPERLFPKRPPEGTASHFLLSDDRGDQPRPLRTVEEILMALPNAVAWSLSQRLYALEVWSTRDAHRLVAYTPKGIPGTILENHLMDLNQALRLIPGPPFPPFPQDCRVRVARLEPLRNPHYPFATDLGHGTPQLGPKTMLSVLLNAFPQMPADYTVVTQLPWRRHNYPGDHWRANPFLHLEFSPFRRRDWEAVEAKKHAEQTFTFYPRFLEILGPTAPKKTRVVDHVLAALGAWDRPGGNRLVPTRMGHWWPSDIVGEVHATYHRVEGANAFTGPTNPHLSVQEMGAFVNPSTAGIRNRSLLQASTRPLPASTYQRTRRLERILDPALPTPNLNGPSKPTQATAEDVLAILGNPPRAGVEPSKKAPDASPEVVALLDQLQGQEDGPRGDA